MLYGLFAGTIGLGAFLLFQVQPMLGKQILPWFGGSPAVWTTCLLFYQTFLLVGYAYAHLVATKVPARRQLLVQMALALLAAATLPVLASPAWKPVDSSWPVPRILLLLTLSVGLPYLLLAGTGTLLQTWCRDRLPDRSPYPLYAISNAGSLLGLISYPLLIEPRLTLPRQSWLWSALFVVWAVGTVIAGRGGAQTEPLAERPPVAAGERVWWLLLAASGTALLMAVTNQICIDVAAIPFLWVLPLTLYLATFIVAFGHERLYHHPVAATLWLVALVLAWQALMKAINLSIGRQLGAFCLLLTVGAWICHGALARSKPAATRLSEFYLMVAAGGALGGLAVAVVAPLALNGLYELQMTVVVVTALLVADVLRDRERLPATPAGKRVTMLAAALTVATVAGAMAFQISFVYEAPLAQHRSFYGVLRVVEEHLKDDAPVRTLVHGRTKHGWQIRTIAEGREPTSYYGRRSGLGLAMKHHPPLAGARRIGAVGLGAGVVASYLEAGDQMVYYELDPVVEQFARDYFTFLSDAAARGASVDVRLGDARLSLEQELAAGRPGNYDLLVLDAFSSDAIPVHLLTTEAFDVYARHVAPGGLLLVHVTNRHFDLVPVVRAQAQRLGWRAEVRRDEGDGRSLMRTTWVWMGPDQPFFEAPVILQATADWPQARRVLWTDDYSSLWPLLH